MAHYKFVAGWTAPILISLLSKGVVPTGTLAGTVSIIMRSYTDGHTITLTGAVTISDATNWIVQYVPASNDLVAGKYRVRVKVRDALNRDGYFPNEEDDIWTVSAA